MIIRSYAKVNLSLRVLKKTSLGLHDIQSNFLQIDLHDEIDVKKDKRDNISFKGNFSNFINGKKNSISQTLNMLRKLKLIKSFYKISIKKNIPVFSGLGGGTSNSAYLTKYLLKKSINKKLIKKIENVVGSDFRLFFQAQGYQTELSKVVNYKKKFKFFILLIYPNIKCSTKEIYSKVKNYSNISKVNFAKLSSKKKYILLINQEINDLQQIVEKKYPIIKKIINYIGIQDGCHVSKMTGSGSACFGLFKSQKTAKFALNRIKKKYPNYWSVVAKTI